MTIEKSLKTLILCSNLGLSLAFVIGWIQHPVAQALNLEAALPLHVSISSIAVILSLFSDTSVLFYFIGTGVWIKDRAKELASAQKKERARLVWQHFENANKLKARSFPFATLGLMLGVFSFILGGAHQVGATPPWVHPLVAFFLVLNAWFGRKFYIQAIDKNLFFLDSVSSELDGQPQLNQI
jgi:hypothetical protein